jgi:glycosyltransferase involved in cell wall biosynthesis
MPIQANRVAHVSSAHPWTDNRVHLREAVSLQDAGYDVVLIAVESSEKVRLSSVTVKLIPRRTRLRRLAVSSLQAVFLAIRSQASVVHLHDPELIWAIPVLRMLGRKVIFDAHEDLPSQIMDKHYLPKPLRSAVARAAGILTLVASSSDHVIAATETIARRFPAAKTTVVKNYPRLRQQDADLPALDDRPLHVVYVGAISDTRGARVMAAAVDDNAFPSDWKLSLAGHFVPASTAHLFSNVQHVERTQVHGKVPPAEARDLLIQARVGLVVLQDTVAYRDSLPTKMFEYMAAGLPVIASDFPLWRSILEPLDCATFVDETSSEAVATALSTYANDSELLHRHGKNAKRAALAELNWASQEKSLLAVYGLVVSVPTGWEK